MLYNVNGTVIELVTCNNADKQISQHVYNNFYNVPDNFIWRPNIISVN